ncbi:MAG: acyl-CoA/acyl-ACP dehydrogenase [Gammaproteobacteria bacterium]|nr:acyl-CoA/acyl-ACP dehydrogenase [Gammaproteobacteria bacterium]
MSVSESENKTQHATLQYKLGALLDKHTDLIKTPQGQFPFSLWQTLAKTHLLTPLLPQSLNGQNATYTEVARAAETLAQKTGLPGLTMAWVMQQLLTRVIASSPSEDVQTRYLPPLLSGESLCCLCISEPDVGAHPKYLSTEAVRDGDTYLLNGEKTYITNGPYASVFIVLAITRVDAGRKSFSAFIIPRDTPGFSTTPLKGFHALQPTAHCQVKLDNCRVPLDYRVGTLNDAFESISKPFRELEDILMLCPIAGSVRALIENITRENQTALPLEDLGQMLAMADTLSTIGVLAAEELDEISNPELKVSFIITSKLMVEQFNTKIKNYLGNTPLGDTVTALANDIDILVNIAKYANTAKQKARAARYLKK